MADYPVLSADELAEMTGRPADSFPESTDEKLKQAELLFKIATCLVALPDDPDQYQLAVYGILSMADRLIMSEDWARAEASPFSSETLGSYSYSKAASKAASGQATGIMWFDLATDKLGVCDANSAQLDGGGIEVFEHDGEFVAGSTLGNVRLLSPSDLEAHERYVLLSRN